MADVLVPADGFLHRFDAALQLRPVVDVDVAAEQHLGARFFPVVGEEVAAFVDADDDAEQAVDAFSLAADGGHHGHAEQPAQLFVV